MGVCRSKTSEVVKKKEDGIDKNKEEQAKSFKNDLIATKPWKVESGMNKQFVLENHSCVYDEIRVKRQRWTEEYKNSLIQIYLVRKKIEGLPDLKLKTGSSSVNPNDEMPFYMTQAYNMYSIRAKDVSRPTRLMPTSPIKRPFLEERARTEKVTDVTWSYKRSPLDLSYSHYNDENYEELLIPGTHLKWGSANGTFGLQPKFPMYVMKGSIIKSIDTSKPFAIPRHEQAKKLGMLIALTKLNRVRGEESDQHIPDLMYRRRVEYVQNIEERETDIDEIPEDDFNQSVEDYQGSEGFRNSDKTSPYIVNIFEVEEGKGFLTPTSSIVFISHRWLTPNDVDPIKGHPDDANNTKLKTLQKFLRDDDFVFFDLWSIPQDPNAVEPRVNAIHSLNTYVDWSNEFVALCIDEENRNQYRARGWTNLELVTALTPVVKARVVKKWNTDVIYGSTCERVGFLDAFLEYRPVTNFTLTPPKEWKFTFDSDRISVQPVVTEVTTAFQNVAKDLDEDNSYKGTSVYKGQIPVKEVLGILSLLASSE